MPAPAGNFRYYRVDSLIIWISFSISGMRFRLRVSGGQKVVVTVVRSSFIGKDAFAGVQLNFDPRIGSLGASVFSELLTRRRLLRFPLQDGSTESSVLLLLRSSCSELRSLCSTIAASLSNSWMRFLSSTLARDLINSASISFVLSLAGAFASLLTLR